MNSYDLINNNIKIDKYNNDDNYINSDDLNNKCDLIDEIIYVKSCNLDNINNKIEIINHDDMLYEAFMNSLKISLKDKDLPIDSGLFYKTHIIYCNPF